MSVNISHMHTSKSSWENLNSGFTYTGKERDIVVLLEAAPGRQQFRFLVDRNFTFAPVVSGLGFADNHNCTYNCDFFLFQFIYQTNSFKGKNSYTNPSMSDIYISSPNGLSARPRTVLDVLASGWSTYHLSRVIRRLWRLIRE